MVGSGMLPLNPRRYDTERQLIGLHLSPLLLSESARWTSCYTRDDTRRIAIERGGRVRLGDKGMAGGATAAATRLPITP